MTPGSVKNFFEWEGWIVGGLIFIPYFFTFGREDVFTFCVFGILALLLYCLVRYKPKRKLWRSAQMTLFSLSVWVLSLYILFFCFWEDFLEHSFFKFFLKIFIWIGFLFVSYKIIFYSKSDSRRSGNALDGEAKKSSNGQLVKTLRGLARIVGALVLLIFLTRTFLFEAINFSSPKIILKQIESPGKKYILTAYNVSPVLFVSGAGKTVFNLRRFGEKMKFVRIDPLTGKGVNPDGNILVMDADYAYPYGVVWSDDDSLLLNLIIPRKEYANESGYLKSQSYVMKDQFEEMKISYGILDSKVYPTETRIWNITSQEDVEKHRVHVW